jgi:hypothetical protein
MPSPFPGMDPFLENADHFRNLHNRLIIYLEDALQPVLPESYYAKSGERVWLEYSERYVEPDVNIHRHRSRHTAGATSTTALLDPPHIQPVIVVLPDKPDDELREPYLEIYAGRGEDKRLVTSIEVLSPSNKTPGDHGRNLYLQKQQEVLESTANLVEIDLLREGTHTSAVPRDAAIAEAGPWDYHVCIHRASERRKYSVYPIRLTDRLPQIAIPLLPGDGDVTLDLQAVFTRCYDAGPYRREIRYDAEQPEPPLTAEQEAWAKDLLHKAGLISLS